MNENINIFEINEAEFQDKVLEASKSSLIIVDFWAPWCGPCKQLTPTLEKITNNSAGKITLIKINIDENKQIASQMGVQSIPAVFAFKDGQPVDGFQGVIPEKKIIEFIEKSLGEKLYQDFSEFYKKLSELFLKKDFLNSKESIEGFIAESPNEYKALGMYIDCMCGLGEIDEADKFIESLNKDAMKSPFVESAIKKLNIIKNNSNLPSLEELLINYKKKPKDFNVMLTLVDKYFAENMVEESFDLLLLNFKENKEKVKVKFIEFFDALGSDNQKTIEYRKKLSSIMFS